MILNRYSQLVFKIPIGILQYSYSTFKILDHINFILGFLNKSIDIILQRLIRTMHLLELTSQNNSIFTFNIFDSLNVTSCLYTSLKLSLQWNHFVLMIAHLYFKRRNFFILGNILFLKGW